MALGFLPSNKPRLPSLFIPNNGKSHPNLLELPKVSGMLVLLGKTVNVFGNQVSCFRFKQGSISDVTFI
jgi:hypothetical protein